MIPFYDNVTDDGQASTIEIDRVYCFAFDRFTDVEWAELDRVYRTLPAFIRYDPIPHWFNVEETAPYLWASVEPVGLQVVGVVATLDWQTWHEQFQARTEGLPSYECD